MVAKLQSVSHERPLQSWRWQQWAAYCAGLDEQMSSMEGSALGSWTMPDSSPCILTHPIYCGLYLALGPSLARLLRAVR